MVATSLPAKAERLLSRAEAAELLGLSKTTLEAWAVRGTSGLPFVKVGRLAKYRLSDLETWLASRTATSTGAHEAAAAS